MILVSACLLGCACRYDGQSKPNPLAQELARRGLAVPVCPEQLGGLPTPRKPSERRGDRVVMNDGRDVTAEYHRGAEETLRLARLYGCKAAVLKERSPSCGSVRKALGLNGVSLDQNVQAQGLAIVGLGRSDSTGVDRLLDFSAVSSLVNADEIPDVPLGHLTGSQRLGAGEGVNVVGYAVLGNTGLINRRSIVPAAALLIDELAADKGGAAPLVGDHAAVLHGNKVIVGCGGNHHADADVSVVRAGVNNIRALGNAAAGHHVLALHGQIVLHIGRSVFLDLVIGEGLVAVGDVRHAACGLGGIGDGCIAGVVVAFAVEPGLDQVDLDISHCERIRCGLRVGKIRQRGADNGDGQKRNAQANRSNLLFHFLLLL